MLQIKARRRSHLLQSPPARLHHKQATGTTQPDAAVGRLGQGVDVAAQHATVLQVQAIKALGPRLATVHAILGADPDAAIPGGQHTPRAALTNAVAAQQLALRVELVNATVRADPYRAVGRLGDGTHHTALE